MAELKNPMGKRKIVSVKLEQRCWEVSVKQSDPDQPGRFWVELPNPSDVAVAALGGQDLLAGGGTDNFSSGELQNKNLILKMVVSNPPSSG